MTHDDTLRAALLDYHASPGRFHVGRRQPEALFGSIRQVLHIAIGRDADEELRQAAGFFIRSALLQPGSDHYALLGLDRSADAVAIRDRYRLMMRLLHPDFTSAEPGVWPPAAPARINLAYEVLSSPALRKEYDRALGEVKAAAPRAKRAFPVSVRRHAQERKSTRAARKGLGAIVVACSLVGAALLSAALLLGSREVGQLVQRAPISPAAPPAALPAAPAVEPVGVAMAAQVPASPAMAAPLPAAPAAERPAIAGVAARAQMPDLPAESQPAPVPAPPVLAASLETPTVAPTPASAPASPQPPPSPRPVAGLTLAEAQPLLVSVLQQVQSGSGERLLTLLDQDARAVPAALALSRQLDALADGGRPVKLTHVEFRAEPGEGRLYVTGHMQLHFDGGAPAPAKRLSLRAEFVSRNGTVVLTSLSGMGGN